MATAASTDAAREYRLIEQLELRIASAATDDKFEAIILKFLPALLLKLATETERNRNLAIKVCQYVNSRVKINQKIQLPVEGLLKNFRESQNGFVRQFSLIFIRQGLTRLTATQAQSTLPGVLQFSVPTSHDFDSTTRKMWSAGFDFLLDALQQWQPSERGSPDEVVFKEQFSISPVQVKILTAQLCKFLLHDAKDEQLHSSLDEDFKPVVEKHYKQRSLVVAKIASFLFTPIFTDQQRLIPATILIVDPNPQAANIADVMFKQCNFDLETEESVDDLFALYQSAKPKLQTRILSILSRSQKSTSKTNLIFDMVEKQLSTPSSGLEASKLRTALFSYLTWVVRISDNIGDISVKVQNILKEYIEMQGWPNMNERSAAEAELRAKSYESIGLLASGTKTSNNVQQPEVGIDLVTWLFTSLRCDTTKDIKGSIEEAIGRIMNATVLKGDEFYSKLKSLLLWNITAEMGEEDPIFYFPTANSTKYPAVRFANKTFPFHDLEARLINLLALVPSERREVAEEGARGLDPSWHISNSHLSTAVSQIDTFQLPDFARVVEVLFSDSTMERYKTFYNKPAVITAGVTYARNVLVCNAVPNKSTEICQSSDWKTNIDALVANDAEIRKQYRLHLSQVDQIKLGDFILLALTGMTMSSSSCAEIALELLSLAPNSLIANIQRAGVALCSQALPIINMQYRAARCFGIMGSIDKSLYAEAGEELTKCENWETAVGEAAVRVRGHLLQVAFFLTRGSLRGEVSTEDAVIHDFSQLLEKVIIKSSDQAMRNAACSCLGQLAICFRPSSTLKLANTDVMAKLIADCKKENESAVTAIGRVIGYSAGLQQHDAVMETVERIFALHEIKKAEFHFALGENLATAVAGFRSLSTMTEFDVEAKVPDWGYHESVLGDVLDKLILHCKTTKPTLKKAASIWLLSLVQYCGDLSPVRLRLRDCQAAFGRLLNDRDEIVQETGSRGLSLVYEKGDKNLQDDLVRDLVQSFTGTSAKMSGTVDEDTQLFETGALPTESGQSVTTYKDIVSLATEMGDPSLVYRFMNLASNNAIWTSRAAFGRFGLGSMLADSSYLSENKKFYPKLFRYRFDPNPNVQRSMNEIWRALVKDSAAVIDEHFDLIMDDLLKSIVSGREWRAREASCAAISDLIQGRDIEKYEKYLDEVWNVAFKVLDDVKESVRAAAMKLCRNLTNMLIRNLETGEGTTKRATTMLSHAMPFLLQQMEGGSAKEVQQYAIITLLEIVKKSPSVSLQPYAPKILETLVNSLSSLEHESINYLHLNADKYGLTTEKLDNMRVSSINASPVTEAIDRCLESLTLAPKIDNEAIGDKMEGVELTSHTPLQDAMRRLEGSFKSAIGLPSKVGLSRVIITLVVRYHAAFRPFADRFTILTRKHILDRNATISIAFSTSLGYLMRVASEKEIRATSNFAQKLYWESQELSHRSVAGEIVQAISKTSNDVFMNFASIFLPFAFVGRNDTDEQVRERFDVPWKDNVGGSRAVKLYLQEIAGLVTQNLKSQLWPIKHACCFAVADLIGLAEGHEQWNEAEARTIWPLLESALDGKTWEGKEKVVSAFPKFALQTKVLWTDVEVSRKMKSIAMREAKRTNEVYRPHAVEALGEFAQARKDLDLAGEVMGVLTNLMETLVDADQVGVDNDHSDQSRNRASTRETIICAIVSCLFKASSTHANSNSLEPAVQIVRKARAEQSNRIDLALYDGASTFHAKIMTEIDGRRDGANQSSNENGAKRRGGEGEIESFSERLVLAVLAEGGTLLSASSPSTMRHTSEPEIQRRSRVKLGLSLAGSSGLSIEARRLLSSVFNDWLETERSRPLREDIDRAIKLNNAAST